MIDDNSEQALARLGVEVRLRRDINILENKLALLERKLAKAVDQRNSLIYPDNDNYYELTSIFNKELAELK